MIQAYGGKSPVLLVLNKIDENPGFEVNRKFLSEKYPTILCFHRTSCKTGGGVELFIADLFRAIEHADNIEARWPRSWYDVKQTLESLTDNFIGYDRYESICRESGVVDDEHMESLASLLNDLGTIVHFDAPILRETNVVNPTWITSAVYRVLTSSALAMGRGALKRSQLANILNLKTHPKARHDYIVEVMKRFELCFFVK
jgi:hypothetical protein